MLRADVVNVLLNVVTCGCRNEKIRLYCDGIMSSGFD